MTNKNAYAQSGVDVEAGYEVVERIKKHVARTERAGVMGALGGFGGMFDLSKTGVKEPVLISGTDGVGTKLMLAIKYDKHDTIGEEVLPELEGKKLKEVLLEPTRIYVKAVLPLIKEELVNGIAHITGGGFIENVPRMFADDLAAEIDESKVPVLPIFKALEKYGQIKHEEMFEIFNMGVGLMLAVSPENVERVKELLDEAVYEIGRIVKKENESVIIK